MSTKRTGPADRTAALQPLSLAEILVLSRRHDAVDLALGSPSFPSTAVDLTEAACAALRSGRNQYEDPKGNADLRAAAAALHGADPDTEITITCGATEGLNVALQCLVQAGDEVVVIEPCFEVYNPAIRLTGARPRPVRLHWPDWHWDATELAAAFGPRTRAVVINSPHNPTGRVLTRADLSELATLCARWDTVVISDEVYAEFVDSPGMAVFPWQIAELADRTVALRSLSKSHAISGWRLGWMYAPDVLTRLLRMVHEVLTVGTAAPLQAAAATVLSLRPTWSEDERARLMAKRALVVSAVTDAGLCCSPPEGSPFALAMLPPDLAIDSSELACRLVTEYRLATAPGGAFFADSSAGERLLRFAFNKSDAVLELATERLAAWRARQFLLGVLWRSRRSQTPIRHTVLAR
jgi:N-succinyldiaminopimelate aminotransferase